MAGGEFAGGDLAVMPETACLRGSRKVERKTKMKKLMIMLAEVAMATVANASTFTWGIS